MPTIPSAISQHFAFASGRMSVLKHLLLLGSDRDRMLGAHGLAEAEMILSELKLGSRTERGDGKADTILTGIVPWIRTEVETMSPPEKHEIFSILWLEEDAPLVSYLLKKHFGLTSEVSTEPSGGVSTWDGVALHKFMQNDKVIGVLPEDLRMFIKTTKLRTGVTAKDIDHAVSAFIAGKQSRIAKKSGSPDIRNYVRHRIDLQNIRTALRLTDAKSTDSKVQLLSGGTILSDELTGDRKSILSAIERSDLPYGLGESIRSAGNDWNAVEQALNDILAQDIARMWNIPMGVEPLFAFAALALSHLKLLRAIIIGKRANLSPQDIKKMLPPFIPASLYILQ